MLRLARPWADAGLAEGEAFGPGHCLLSEAAPGDKAGEHAVLMRGEARGEARHLLQHPYPRRGAASGPDRAGFPPRPRKGKEAEADPEALAALARMNEVTARVQELGEALDDPSTLWTRLRAAWDRAEHEEDPRMAEIVRQARALTPVLKLFRDHIRRVLRRHREPTPLDRVQEMDRASMRWLSRQPGRTTAERAGSEQRILAVVRHQNFDTLENRVTHAYVLLAADVGREWLREHPRAQGSRRYQLVQGYAKLCKAVATELRDLGIGIAEPDVTPNYVLLEDRTYRLIREAWEALLKREKALDELWAWQAKTWTDFAVLAIVLALHDIDGAELIAQSPIRFLSESVNGIWFEQERPIAVFWLRKLGRVVEVMARPEKPGTLLTLARAHVALRISDPLDRSAFPHRVAVWTPHAMTRLDLAAAAQQAAGRLAELAKVPGQQERIRHGLILTPGHRVPESVSSDHGGVFVEAIALDATGASLAAGRAAIRAFLGREIWGAA
ncbi:hypothetical protein [Cereibacter sediminicola]|uniref:hypothetical protein n=1 Tax=Cereibacter sediminicola TaxID=2584941 RepID=UPI0011A85255|nr:hypothetical protein [Cereibacter sediminicola]